MHRFSFGGLLAILWATHCLAQLADTYSAAADGYRQAAAQACSGQARACYERQAAYHDCLAGQIRTGNGNCEEPPRCGGNGCTSRKMQDIGRGILSSTPMIGDIADTSEMVRALLRLHREKPQPVDDGFDNAQQSTLALWKTGR